MPAHAGTSAFASSHYLAECISGCEYIDNARRIISADYRYNVPIEICNTVVLNLCKNYCVNEDLTTKALMICTTFISTRGADQHISSNTPIVFFWTCVGVVCFTLTMKSHLGDPKLEHTLKIARIKDCDHSRIYYKQLQIHVLTAVNWKLLFPTGGH